MRHLPVVLCVQRYKKQRMDDKAEVATINRELAFLRRVFNVALQRKKVRHTPFRDENGQVVVRLFREDNQRERYLDAKTEEPKLLAACARSRSQWLLPVVQVALHTGLRKTSIVTLQWGDLDFDRKLVTIRATNSKTGRMLRVPMNLLVEQTLLALGKRSDGSDKGLGDPVFANEADERVTSIRTAWETAVSEAGLVNFTFHDLRHTFASRLVAAGVPLLHVSKLLGHSTILMTQRYSHASDEALASAVGKLIQGDEKFHVDSVPPQDEDGRIAVSVVQ